MPDHIVVRKSATFSEMMQAGDVLARFNDGVDFPLSGSICDTGYLRIVGEGSSRKFPAGNLINLALRDTVGKRWAINGLDGTEACEMDHGHATVVLMSNSGKTNEVLQLAEMLKKQKHRNVFAVTADESSPLAKMGGHQRTYIMTCGEEAGIAATKSVFAQALILQAATLDTFPTRQDRQKGAESVNTILTDMEIDSAMTQTLSGAPTIYLVGPRNGVVDELSLKFSECSMRAVAMPGTDIVHGYQESAGPKDAVILIEPPQQHQKKFKESLVEKCGLPVFAVSERETMFPTIRLPRARHEGLSGYFQLAAGWRIISEIAQNRQINIDHPSRATKVGYEAPIS